MEAPAVSGPNPRARLPIIVPRDVLGLYGLQVLDLATGPGDRLIHRVDGAIISLDVRGLSWFQPTVGHLAEPAVKHAITAHEAHVRREASGGPFRVASNQHSSPVPRAPNVRFWPGSAAQDLDAK
jgi:hypothetical protein